MFQMRERLDLESPEYIEAVRKGRFILRSLMMGIQICKAHMYRDPQGAKNSLFTRVADDLMQSAVGVHLLSLEGINQTCMREFRYLIEISIKSAITAQKYSKEDIFVQINSFSKIVNNTNIGMVDDIDYYFFDEHTSTEFRREIKRLYGELCNYVHGTSKYLKDRIVSWDSGKTIGYENQKELIELNNISELVYSFVLTLMLHSIDSYIAGDLLVDSDGKTFDWHFTKSKYISKIDEHFDYKHERSQILDEVKELRNSSMIF